MTRHGGIAVIIPTVPGREADLERTVAAFEAEPDCKVHPTYGHTAVGAGWARGLDDYLASLGRKRRPRYVLFGNDDMWPSEGWLDPAVEASRRGYTPCPVMFNSKGELESAGAWKVHHRDWHVVHWSPLPFFRLDEWEVLGEGFPPIHYWSDNWLAVSAQYRLDRPIVVRHGFEFTHTWAQPSRQYLEDDAARAAGRLFNEFEADCKRRYAAGEYPLCQPTLDPDVAV